MLHFINTKKALKNYTCFILRRFGLFLIHLQSKTELDNLTGLAVLVLLWTSFASHCYFLRHRVFWFWIASIARYCFILWL